MRYVIIVMGEHFDTGVMGIRAGGAILAKAWLHMDYVMFSWLSRDRGWGFVEYVGGRCCQAILTCHAYVCYLIRIRTLHGSSDEVYSADAPLPTTAR